MHVGRIGKLHVCPVVGKPKLTVAVHEPQLLPCCLKPLSKLWRNQRQGLSQYILAGMHVTRMMLPSSKVDQSQCFLALKLPQEQQVEAVASSISKCRYLF